MPIDVTPVLSYYGLVIKPAKHIVILRPTALKTKSGLEGGSSVNSAPEIGLVEAIGAGTPPISLKVGDTVVYRKYMENKVFIPSESQELNFIDFKDIVANLGKQK